MLYWRDCQTRREAMSGSEKRSEEPTLEEFETTLIALSDSLGISREVIAFACMMLDEDKRAMCEMLVWLHDTKETEPEKLIAKAKELAKGGS